MELEASRIFSVPRNACVFSKKAINDDCDGRSGFGMQGAMQGNTNVSDRKLEQIQKQKTEESSKLQV